MLIAKLGNPFTASPVKPPAELGKKTDKAQPKVIPIKTEGVSSWKKVGLVALAATVMAAVGYFFFGGRSAPLPTTEVAGYKVGQYENQFEILNLISSCTYKPKTWGSVERVCNASVQVKGGATPLAWQKETKPCVDILPFDQAKHFVCPHYAKPDFFLKDAIQPWLSDIVRDKEFEECHDPSFIKNFQKCIEKSFFPQPYATDRARQVYLELKSFLDFYCSDKFCLRKWPTDGSQGDLVYLPKDLDCLDANQLEKVFKNLVNKLWNQIPLDGPLALAKKMHK